MGKLLGLCLAALVLVVAVPLFKLLADLGFFLPSYTHRFRLDIEIQKAGQRHTASGVIEIKWQSQSIGPGWSCKTTGEAIPVALGPSQHVIALLRQFHPRRTWLCNMALVAYGLSQQQSHESLEALAQKRGRVVVPSRAIPTFVMFTDENYPSTVTVVDENDFNIQLGAALTSITLELTNAPITKVKLRRFPPWPELLRLHRSVPGVYSAYYPDFVSD